ncbi:cupin domain-containing protein [Altererythrobacter sp. KTW20L]|uniref:cupin domain-containing protein n=1 Tax=Altererythrobacter sp. KTW20L TaxID=2942210 RepID=UPI0020C0AC12|nr:cupin domain-containing protein [Altererythrobacter sp. KTW20L]MCL6250517.1 cupin domain-containing protein [Altererythrobacter sp. KTW20L]
MGASRQIIQQLGLQPHPEGGWYRETWRGPAGRETATAIHFLLASHQSSHWHRVDAAETWLWHAGDPLLLSLAKADSDPVREIVLGGNVLAGEQVQYVVEPDEWQAAAPLSGPQGYTLVSCVVVPAFRFEGFVLAPPSWRPGA